MTTFIYCMVFAQLLYALYFHLCLWMDYAYALCWIKKTKKGILMTEIIAKYDLYWMEYARFTCFPNEEYCNGNYPFSTCFLFFHSFFLWLLDLSFYQFITNWRFIMHLFKYKRQINLRSMSLNLAYYIINKFTWDWFICLFIQININSLYRIDWLNAFTWFSSVFCVT